MNKENTIKTICAWGLFAALLLSSCTSTSTNKEPIDTTYGWSIAGIELRSTAQDVEDKLGKPSELINHNKFSTEMVYSELGLSFVYHQGSTNKMIFCIKTKPPYKLQTSKGIILGESTMQDVQDAYGELVWRSSDGSDYWFSEHDGIEYGIFREKSVPQYPLNKELHLSRTIVRIDLDCRY